MTEWGPCLKGVNPETELLSVKSHDGVERRRQVLPGYDPEALTATKSAAPEKDAPEGETTASRALREKAHDLLTAHPRHAA